MLPKHKHIRKENGPKLCGMNFTGDPSSFSRKIITFKMRQNLGHCKKKLGFSGSRKVKEES